MPGILIWAVLTFVGIVMLTALQANRSGGIRSPRDKGYNLKAAHYRSLRAASSVLMLALGASSPALALQFALRIDDIAAPAFRASGISADLENDHFSATIKQLSFQGHSWKNLRLTCPKIAIGNDAIACTQGTLTGEQSWPVRFNYAPNAKRLILDLTLPASEHWHIDARWGKRWELAASIDNAQVAHLKTWLPQDMPVPSAGTVSGKLHFSGSTAQLLAADADFRLAGIAFSDASGRHAGEKIGGTIRFGAHRANQELVWEGEVRWDNGELYWEPFYLTGGARLTARGRIDPLRIALEQGLLNWPAIGEIAASGSWDRSSRTLTAATLQGAQLKLDALYSNFMLPFLGRTVLAKSTASGELGFAGRFADGEIKALDLTIDQGSLQDQEGRFGLQGVHLELPWRAQAATVAEFGIVNGKVLALPLGGFKTAIQIHDKKIGIPKLAVPILGGTLNIENFQAASSEQGWQWEFEGGLTPIAMEQLAAALHWPTMHGTLSGVVPRVHFAAGELALDGALLIKAFDGTAVIQKLLLLDALGPAPRIQADIDMRNLDLDLLTRTFSFGSIQGRVDVSVNGLELSNWKPVAFDAAVRSSPGDYPRKISQRAVQNISSLGGAGAGAAIQRSFLGVFEQFGYSRLGLSCVLKNTVCLMGGIAAAPQGYIIVEGGGIPAITVIGYNRSVSWNELVSRLQRVTQGNARPVVQ